MGKKSSPGLLSRLQARLSKYLDENYVTDFVWYLLDALWTFLFTSTLPLTSRVFS
ncbi:unnamed protein product, partial [Ostreobium quekettii]